MKRLFITISLILTLFRVQAVEVTVLLDSIKTEKDLGKRMVKVAEQLIGTGRDDYYAKDSIASLRLTTEGFTPMTFVNSVAAIALSGGESNGNALMAQDNFSRLSCRRGENVGFPSIMWHTSDWISDNIYRGTIKELTESYIEPRTKTKSLDYLSRHRGEYAVLSNPEIYDKVRMTEMGFRTHRVPYLQRHDAKKKVISDELKDGDIIILIPNQDGVDMYEMGIVKIKNDAPYLIHFSNKQGKVVMESEPLDRYMNSIAKYICGFRWVRII